MSPSPLCFLTSIFQFVKICWSRLELFKVAVYDISLFAALWPVWSLLLEQFSNNGHIYRLTDSNLNHRCENTSPEWLLQQDLPSGDEADTWENMNTFDAEHEILRVFNMVIWSTQQCSIHCISDTQTGWKLYGNGGWKFVFLFFNPSLNEGVEDGQSSYYCGPNGNISTMFDCISDRH